MNIAPCELCGKRRVLFRIVGSDIHACMTCRRKEEAAADGGKFVNQHGEQSGRRNAYPGERVGPLDAKQIKRFFALAKKAFSRLHGHEASAVEMEAWRRVEQARACGISSLRATMQSHWPALLAHFLDLAGQGGRAFEVHMRPDAALYRRNLWLLKEELRKAGLAENYAETICRQAYKTSLENATARQVFRVLVTVRNRGLSKARKAARPRTQDLAF